MSWAEVKHALNSTLGSDGFQALDEYISSAVRNGNNRVTTIYDTPGTYTYVVPFGVTEIQVSACGAGGGGGAENKSNNSGGGGGGGAAIKECRLKVKSGEKIEITVGAGGKGGEYVTTVVETAEDGQDGGDTVFGEYFTLGGGKGGGGAKSTTEGSGSAGAGGIAAKMGVNGGAGGRGGCYTQPYVIPVSGQNSDYATGGECNGQYKYGGGGGASLGDGKGYYWDSSDTYGRYRRTTGGYGAGGDGGSYNSRVTSADADLLENGSTGANGYVEIKAGTDVSPIKNIQRGTVEFGEYDSFKNVALSGFTNLNKMIVLLHGGYKNQNSPYVSMLELNELTISKYKYDGSDRFSYQVIEFK